MSTSPEQLAAPSIDALLGETVATLIYAAMAYLEPQSGDAQPDLASAELAVDVAGVAFDRVSARLRPDARGALTVMLTEARLAIVRKRGRSASLFLSSFVVLETYRRDREGCVSDVLVLNFTYEALNITSFQRAVKLIFSGKAEVVHGREHVLTSARFEMRMPSIIRMLYYIRRPMQKVALTKKNILLRDDYICQYCGVKGERMMTVDHVHPRSKGGPSTWENLVCACMRCNNRKNNRTPEHANMPLKRKPKTPKYIPWIRVKRNTLPGEWHKFLFLYNVSIEEQLETV